MQLYLRCVCVCVRFVCDCAPSVFLLSTVIASFSSLLFGNKLLALSLKHFLFQFPLCLLPCLPFLFLRSVISACRLALARLDPHFAQHTPAQLIKLVATSTYNAYTAYRHIASQLVVNVSRFMDELVSHLYTMLTI